MSEAADFIDSIYDEIGENDGNEDVKDWLSTGVLPLNKALSGDYHKGLPMGRIIEIFGGESSGKTLIATKAMEQTQARGGLAVFLDFEHAFSIERARQLGLSDERGKWIYKQPTVAEEGFAVIKAIANKVEADNLDTPITIVVDSVAAMTTQEEMETDFGKENMRTQGALSRLMSSSLRKIAPIINKKNITLIFLNQTRDNLGVSFGDKKKTTGGNALKFFASVRIKLAKIGKEKRKDEIVGEKVVSETIKNKCSPPFKKAEWLASYTEGIDLEMTHIRALKDMGKLGKTKGFVEFDGKKYREYELAEILKKDRNMYADLLKLLDDEDWE